MTLRSIVRDLRESFGNLSRRNFEPKTSSTPGLSAHDTGKSSDELRDSLVVIQESNWSSLPPELLLDVVKRLKQDDDDGRSYHKDVIVCTAVCTTWRDICNAIVRNPEFFRGLTLPVSLKQPGPRAGLIQCFIKRDKSKQTYRLYVSLPTATILHHNGSFLLSAKRSRRMTYTEYAISKDSKIISRSSSGYIGRLRSNLSGSRFIIYDTQPPYNARTPCPRKVARGGYPTAQVKYEPNVLGTRAPRQMHCTMHSIPTSAVKFGDKEEMPLVLGNKAPRWHAQLQGWCLNFHESVTMPSVKNFQLVAAPAPTATGAATSDPPSPSDDDDDTDVILQFVRVSEDTFAMDYGYPLSAFQAFAICLTSFDTQVSFQAPIRTL